MVIDGLPPAASAEVTVTGPNAYARGIIASEILSDIPPGLYSISASEASAGADRYAAASPSASALVTGGATARATVLYSLTTGSIALTLSGLPANALAAITVSGPGGFSRHITAAAAIAGLAPGVYLISSASVQTEGHTYTPTAAEQHVQVSASATPASVAADYRIATGALIAIVSGLPQGASGNVTVTGPGGYRRAVTTPETLLGLTPGAYTIAAAMVQHVSSFWAPLLANQVVSVPASSTALQATVTYTSANGGLPVNITGLPSGVDADVRVTGPNGYAQSVTAAQTLRGLLPGLYSVTASAVTSTGSTYTPSPATQPAVVGGGVSPSVNVPYTQTAGPPPATLNLTIDGMHVQQVVQSYAGGVPLVAGKEGLLRVFVRANASNTAAAAVRVRLYLGGMLVSTVTIAPPGSSVPTAVSQATLAGSWNTLIPASLMVPGLQILADVDPTNAIAESADGDNTFPVSGAAQAMDVRSLPSFDIRFVPVTQSANGLTGGVSAGNAASYLSMAAKVFPLGTVNLDVRSPFTTSAPVLQSGDANGAWLQILSELNALRAADGSTRYYAGIAKVTYTSGVAGLGYLPGRATLSWDHLPSASEVVAHELGHNFGRFHAPCGGAGSPDPAYPYAAGDIGVYGLDLATATLKSSTMNDLMGYCSSTWISDYTYAAVMSHRIANPFVAMGRSLANPGRRAGLLVWGRIERGRIVLEPSFQVEAPPSLPSRPGPNRLQAFGPLGESLLDLSFEGERVMDASDPTNQHFAFVVPFDLMHGLEPTILRVSALGRAVERRSAAAAQSSPSPAVTRERGGAIGIRWSNQSIQGVLVRDARTREILSFARGGAAIVTGATQDIELTISDGLRSTRQRHRVPQ